MPLSFQHSCSAPIGIRQSEVEAKLQSLLARAIARAQRQQHPIIASLSFPLDQFAPFHLFAVLQHLELSHRFFWLHGQECLIGAGTSLVLEAQGADVHRILKQKWDAAREQVVAIADEQVTDVLPTFLGGFRFDPQARHTSSAWRHFPDGALILPQVLFRSTQGGCSLTINHSITPEDTVLTCKSAIHLVLDRIFQISASLAQDALFRSSIVSKDLDTSQKEPWKQLVSDAVRAIRQDTMSKVVLARSMIVNARSQSSFDIPSLVYRLHQQAPLSYIFAMQFQETAFVGATPEQLVAAQAGKIRTMSLAGSALRGQTVETDARIGQALLTSRKDREEHAIVTDAIMQQLGPLCNTLHRPVLPQLLRLPTIQHLQTPIWGQLRQGYSLLDAVSALHPTPAVGGLPSDGARTYIRTYEQMDRGWYAGPLGWIDLNGDGEFIVALRSGLVQKQTATLFAGCGIVANSQPESEYQETCLKFQVMLNAIQGQS